MVLKMIRLLLLTLITPFALNVSAVPVQFDLSYVATTSSIVPQVEWVAGDIFDISLTFDSLQAGDDQGAQTVYFIDSFSITSNGETLTGNLGQIIIRNDFGLAGQDQILFAFDGGAEGPTSAGTFFPGNSTGSLGGLDASIYSSLGLSFRDTTGTAISDESLITNPSLLDAFSPNTLVGNGRFTDGQGNIISGFSTSVKIAAVPEPATCTLMALGLLGLGFARRKLI